MIEQAIPTGTSIWRHTSTEYRRSVARVNWIITRVPLLLLCFTFLMGCRKPAGPTVVAPQGPQGQAAAAQPGEGEKGRNTLLQMPFDQVAKLVMINVGKAYQMATLMNGKPPKDAVELDAGTNGLKTKRDMQFHEVDVAYGVNLAKLDNPADYMLAWEKEPTNDGYRMVLMADIVTVKYVSQAEFEKMKKAK